MRVTDRADVIGTCRHIHRSRERSRHLYIAGVIPLVGLGIDIPGTIELNLCALPVRECGFAVIRQLEELPFRMDEPELTRLNAKRSVIIVEIPPLDETAVQIPFNEGDRNLLVDRRRAEHSPAIAYPDRRDRQPPG